MIERRPALGKGLSALIPDAPEPARQGAIEVDIDLIAPNEKQPRVQMDEAKLDELAQSIKENGVIQPILVQRIGDLYRIIAGERRWRAAQRAGLLKVPVVVREVPIDGDRQLLQLALIENIQREDLNPIEEAMAYHQLHDDFQLTQEEISRRVGKERSTVANFLRLLKLPDPVKKLLASGQLSMGHARALLAIESPKKQEQLADRVVRKNLNVRQTEMLASESSPKTAEKKEKEKDVFTRDAEDKLQRTLRTKVEIDRRRRGGVIHIRYGSEDELIRVVDELMGRRR